MHKERMCQRLVNQVLDHIFINMSIFNLTYFLAIYKLTKKYVRLNSRKYFY